jgi:ribosomal protein L11 methyltransferase
VLGCTAVTLRAFRLAGPGAGAALDRLHVLAEVRGAVEEEDAVTVWLDGPLPPQLLASVTVQELPAAEANVSATGREQDRAILLAPGLVVRPPWVPAPPGFAGVDLVVPRGMAFGSGEHASTQAALLAMHAAWASPASLLDVGTGSGILARYAQLRCCPSVAACDVDPVAVAAAAALLPGALVFRGGPQQFAAHADAVVANLAAPELHDALDAILSVWNRRAPLVLAGLRAGEVDGVRARLPGPAHELAVAGFRALTCPGGCSAQPPTPAATR